MALVQGEDTESDEEINTDQLHTLTVSPDGSLSGLSSHAYQASKAHKAGIVMGEESETDEEDEEESSVEQTDSGGGPQSNRDRLSVPPHVGHTGSVSPTESPRRSSQDSSASAPPS